MQATTGVTQAGGRKAAVAYQHDLPLRMPASQEPDQNLCSLDCCAMPFAQLGTGCRSEGGNA